MNDRKRSQYVVSFAGISLVGLAIDVSVFNILVFMRAPIFYASILSICCAVAFVFFTSAYRLFESAGNFLFQKFCLYLAYQVLMMLGISATLAYIHAIGMPVISHQFALKFLPLPFTFTCNALVTFILLRK
tara:strand:- start:147 stop:539 length:393 start_codon:yes stop_codon:yes gene_type:complete